MAARSIHPSGITLAELKALPGLIHADASMGEVFSFSKFPSGFPKGALIELFGPHGCGKTELVFEFLKEHPDARVAWIESELLLYPEALVAAGARLERVLLIEPQGEGHTLRVLHQVLQASVFEIVIFSPPPNLPIHERELRRLQLGAQKAHACLILLSTQATQKGAWPISIQVEVRRGNPVSNSLQLTPLKLKKGSL